MVRARLVTLAVAAALVAGCGSDEPESTSQRDLDVALAAKTIADFCVDYFDEGTTAEGLEEMYAAADVMRDALQAEPDNDEYVKKAERAADGLADCGEVETSNELFEAADSAR